MVTEGRAGLVCLSYVLATQLTSTDSLIQTGSLFCHLHDRILEVGRVYRRFPARLIGCLGVGRDWKTRGLCVGQSVLCRFPARRDTARWGMTIPADQELSQQA